MQGKSFAQEYINLKAQEEYLTYSIDILSDVEESERTEKAIEAIKETRDKVKSRLAEMDSFEVVKRIV